MGATLDFLKQLSRKMEDSDRKKPKQEKKKSIKMKTKRVIKPAYGKNVCMKIEFDGKEKKQHLQPNIGPDLPKFQNGSKVCIKIESGGLNIKPDGMNWLPCNGSGGWNIKPDGRNWLPCNVVKLKEKLFLLD